MPKNNIEENDKDQYLPNDVVNIIPDNININQAPVNIDPLVEIRDTIERLLERGTQLMEAQEHINLEGDPDEALFMNVFGNDEVLEINDNIELPAINNQNIQAVYTPPVGNNRNAVVENILLLENNNIERLGDAQELAEPVIGDNIRWRPLYELGGYGGAKIARALGRTIFNNIPCYQRMSEDCRRAGRDPLGEINVISRGILGNNTEAEMNYMSNWIRQNGQLVGGDVIEFPNLMPGYRPNIILATSENDSFLLVDETIANGAPSNSQYIYSWRGGRQFYNNNNQRLGDVMNLRIQIDQQPENEVVPQRNQRQIEARVEPVIRDALPNIPANNLPKENIKPKEANYNAGNPKNNNEGKKNVEKTEDDKTEDNKNKSPHAVMAKYNIFQILKLEGFEIKNTESSLSFVKDNDDGTKTIISDANGKSISVAKSFNVRVIDNTILIETHNNLSSDDVIILINGKQNKIKM